jgi:hypothetical protein
MLRIEFDYLPPVYVSQIGDIGGNLHKIFVAYTEACSSCWNGPIGVSAATDDWKWNFEFHRGDHVGPEIALALPSLDHQLYFATLLTNDPDNSVGGCVHALVHRKIGFGPHPIMGTEADRILRKMDNFLEAAEASPPDFKFENLQYE